MVQNKDGILKAAKIFKNEMEYEHELQILKTLHSPWTLEIYDWNKNGNISQSLPNKNGEMKAENKNQPYIIMELAENGELFDYLEFGCGIPETIARYYFKNLILALEYFHKQGIYHRDIKLQNLLLSSDFSLKIADFGLASSFSIEEEKPCRKGTIR